jgi:hypothetical protein
MISQKLLPAAFDSRHARQIGRQPQVLQSPGQLALGATLLCSQGPQMRTNKIFGSFVWHIFLAAVAVHFKRRQRKPLVASKRKGKVLRLL